MMSLERYYGVKPPHFIQEEDPVVSGVRQNGGYDDGEGISLQKAFLKSPGMPFSENKSRWTSKKLF
jgi:hypothetical protein